MTQLLEDATENAIDPESLELVQTGAGDLELCGEGVEVNLQIYSADSIFFPVWG